ELVATHDRAPTPGTWRTQLDHLPPEKVPGLVLTRESCQAQADAIGPATGALVQRLLDHRPEDRLRSAGRIVRLAQTYPTARVEAAAARALHFGEASYPALKRILVTGPHAEPCPMQDPSTGRCPDAAPVSGCVAGPGAGSEPVGSRFQFVRHASEFVAAFFGARGEHQWLKSTN